MSKITYSNKSYLDLNPDVSDINKVKDTDMNSIKNAVNQNGSYVELTESSTAGNFYCTLEGNLSSGDVVKVTFPQVTTTTTQNLQLSIDGGTTYYPITDLDNNNLQIGNIDKNIELEYGGNYGYNTFVAKVHNNSSNSQTEPYSCDYINKINSSITAYLSADYTNPSSSTYNRIPFNTSVAVGDKLTLLNDGTIKVGSGISKVYISGDIVLPASIANGGKNFVIRLNGVIKSRAWHTVTSGNYNANVSLSRSSRLIEVQENDIIDAAYYGTANDIINGSESFTQITVRVAE